MKKTTCKSLRGACDMEITGETPEEMGQKCKKHVTEMIQSGDQAHKEAADNMSKLSKEEQFGWYQEFKNNFDSLPDA